MRCATNLALLLSLTAPFLTSCATTVTGTDLAGNPLTIKTGFGNRVEVQSLVIRPDPEVIAAGERMGRAAWQSAPGLVTTIVEKRTGQ